MKKRISITFVLVFILSIAPVIAFDKGGSDKVPVTFQAFNNMSAMEREALTPLTETELASIVEGVHLEVPMATIQQMQTLFLAILEAQRSDLGCNESCVAQLARQLAPSLNGANIAFVNPSPNGCNESCGAQIVHQLAPSLNGANIAFVNQTPSPNGSLTTNGANIAFVNQTPSLNGSLTTRNVSTVQQSIGRQ